MLMYKRHRYPGEIIIYPILLYHRYSLSLRDIAEISLHRDIDASYETIRVWNNKFSSTIAANIRKKRAYKSGDRWHMDEVRVVICGEVYWL